MIHGKNGESTPRLIQEFIHDTSTASTYLKISVGQTAPSLNIPFPFDPTLSSSVTLEQKGNPFWGRPCLVGQPPKNKEGKQGATQQLRTSRFPTRSFACRAASTCSASPVSISDAEPLARVAPQLTWSMALKPTYLGVSFFEGTLFGLG